MAVSNFSLTNAAAQTVFSSAGNNIVSTIHFCNFSGNAVTISVFLVATGGTAGNTNIIYSNHPINSGDTFIVDTEKMILGNGDFLAANCSSSSAVTATVTTLAA